MVIRNAFSRQWPRPRPRGNGRRAGNHARHTCMIMTKNQPQNDVRYPAACCDLVRKEPKLPE